MLPVSIFAITSFETICSIGHMIKKPKTNLPLAIIIISFTIAACFAMIIQFFIYGTTGLSILNSNEPIYLFAIKIFSNYPVIAKVINVFVFGSIIGGAFSSLTSNVWNLHTFATNNLLPFKKYLIKKNKFNVPWVSLVIEGCLAILILIITSNQVALQNMTVFGIVIAYLLNTIAAFKINNSKLLNIISSLGILSSLFILYLCLQKIFQSGISTSFIIIFLIGIILMLLKKYKTI